MHPKDPSKSTSPESQRVPVYADEAVGPFHHVIFTQAGGAVRDGRVHVASIWNGNLSAYGDLVPGTWVVLPEDELVIDERAVALNPTLRPLLLRGFSTRSLLKRTLAYARARRIIHRIVEQASFVQLQHVGSFGFVAGSIAASLGKPFYLDMGGTMRETTGFTVQRALRSRLARRYYARVEEKLARSASLLIAVSQRLHELFPPSPAPKAVVSHSMIRENQIHKRDTACTGEKTVLFVATRLVERKGLHYLIKAVRRLVDDSIDVELELAGVGDFEPRLRQVVAECGLESRVLFHGGLPVGEDLWNLYRRADIVVLPSILPEGTPRMILEAWAAGAAVLATRVDGVTALVRNGEDALLIDPGDVNAIAAGVQRIRKDAALCKRIVEGGYRRIVDMTYEARLPLLRAAFEQHLPGLLPDLDTPQGVPGAGQQVDAVPL